MTGSVTIGVEEDSEQSEEPNDESVTNHPIDADSRSELEQLRENECDVTIEHRPGDERATLTINTELELVIHQYRLTPTENNDARGESGSLSFLGYTLEHRHSAEDQWNTVETNISTLARGLMHARCEVDKLRM